jgi:hypothetical protein
MRIGKIPVADRPAGFAERQCDAPAKVVPGTFHHEWRVARFSPLGMDPMRCALIGSMQLGSLRLCPYHARRHDMELLA